MAYDGILMLLKLGDGEDPEGFTTIAASTTNNFTINNEIVDITDKDSSWRKILDGAGTQSVSISGSYVFDGSTQQDAIVTNFTENTSKVYQIAWGDSNTLTGEFFHQNFTLTGEVNGGQTFDITLESSGEITFV